MEKARQMLQPLPHIAIEHHAAFFVGLAREQNIVIRLRDGGRQSKRQGVDRKPSLPRVARGDVLVARRVIELFLIRRNEHGVMGELPVVDLRAVQFDVPQY